MKLHLTGVGGASTVGLASLLCEAGHLISADPATAAQLRSFGLEVADGPVGTAVDLRQATTLRDHVVGDRALFLGLGGHAGPATSALLAWLLASAGGQPGRLLSARPLEPAFPSAALGDRAGPFVVDGSAFDLHQLAALRPDVVALTGLEPAEGGDLRHLEQLVRGIPADGVLAAWAGCAIVRGLAEQARCRVVWFSLAGDESASAPPTWMAAPMAPRGSAQPFELFVGGSAAGIVLGPLHGRRNVRSATAAVATVAETTGAPLQTLLSAVARFRGLERDQERVGVADGVIVFDDRAADATALRETMAAIEPRLRGGRLWLLLHLDSPDELPRYEAALTAADEWLLSRDRPLERLREARAGDAVVCISTRDQAWPDRVLAMLTARSSSKSFETKIDAPP